MKNIFTKIGVYFLESLLSLITRIEIMTKKRTKLVAVFANGYNVPDYGEGYPANTIVPAIGRLKRVKVPENLKRAVRNNKDLNSIYAVGNILFWDCDILKHAKPVTSKNIVEYYNRARTRRNKLPLLTDDVLLTIAKLNK